MKASADGDVDDLVAVRRQNIRELTGSLGVGAAGQSDEQFAVDAKDVATFGGAGRGDVFELAKGRERFSKGCGFGPARIGTQGKNDGELVEDDGGVFDEHGVGEIALGRQGDDVGAKFSEEQFVGAMLLGSFGEIDRLAANERKLAVHDAGTDSASDGREHGGDRVYDNGVKD